MPIEARRRRRFTRRAVQIGLPVLIAVWIGGTGYWAVVANRESSRTAQQTWEMLAVAEDLLSSMKDAERGQRGYLLTGDKRFLEPYVDAIAHIPKKQQRLLELTRIAENDHDQAELAELIRSKLDFMAATIQAFDKKGAAAAMELVRTDHGRASMVEIRKILEQLKARDRAALQGLLRRSRRAAASSQIVSWVGCLLLLGLFALASGTIERDVKRLEQSAAEIRDLNETLERRVEERTGELEAANRDMEAFSYSVSHDLRAPLRSVEGFGKILLRDYPEGRPLDSRAQDFIRRMSASTVRMGQLIEDLLMLSRLSRTELNPATVDLSSLAVAVTGELRERDPARIVEVHIEPGLEVDGDPRLMRVALANLLGNAWKFTSKAEDARLEFASAGDNGRKTFVVKDNGAGFDMAHAANLFAPFQRLHRQSEFEGSGIGLATVQRVIRRHGGDIWAESEPGKGAAFYFTLASKQLRL